MTKRIVLCAFLFLIPLSSLAADGPLFLWQAEKDGATIHLFGSIHAGQESWYPLDERIEQVFAAADTIACELNMADQGMLMKASMLAMQEGMYPADEKLTDHISEETWQQLQAVEGLMVPASMLERMRPGLAAITVAQAVMTRAGLDPQQGVDMHLLRRATESEQPIVSLETPEQQIALIFGPDAVIDSLLLSEALEESPETMIAMIEKLVAAWRAGDPEAMETAYREDWKDDERMERFHEQLLVERNARMADRLDQARAHWFVVVGSLHLCGEDGIPALLADRGWTVNQVGAR